MDNANEKKIDKLIEAAKAEFAARGYEKASTAQICRNAGVSKGLLFHHFGTKKRLYLEVYEGILMPYIKAINKIDSSGCKTYLDVILEMSNVKIKYFLEHPGVYEILVEANYNPPDELKADVKAIFEKHIKIEDYFSETVFEKYEFRKEIDPKKAWEIVRAVTTLVEGKIMQRYDISREKGQSVLEQIIAESDDFFEYFDIVFNGITEKHVNIPKRRAAREHDDNGEGRNEAV